MNHVFNVDEAVFLGLEKSIIMSNFRFWLEKNKANGKNLYEDHYWTYNSSKALASIFPYWSQQKIARLIRELESDGYLISSNFNKAGYDRTKWYSMPEYSIAQMETNHCSNLNNGKFNSKQPIPDINTDSKTDTPSPLLGEIVDMYLSIVKDNCNAKGCLKDHFLSSKERVKPLLARISENEEHQKEEFWQAYFNNCKTISWIRDGIDGEAVCTIDMLINKTKFYRNVEAFWA